MSSPDSDATSDVELRVHTLPASNTTSIWHIKVTDNVRSAVTATAILDHLHEAADADASIVILQIGSNTFRTDLAATIARQLDAMPTPTAVMLHDASDNIVGVDALLLGLCANTTWIGPSMRIEQGLSQNDHDLAPENTDFERSQQLLITMAQTKMRARNVDPEHIQRVCVPTDSVSLVRTKTGEWSFEHGDDEETNKANAAPTNAQPPVQHVQIVSPSARTAIGNASYRVDIPAEMALSLGWAREAPTSVRALERVVLTTLTPNAQSSKPARTKRTTRTVRESFDEKNSQVREAIDAAELLARDAMGEIRRARDRRGTAVRIGKGVLDRTNRTVTDMLDRGALLVSDSEDALRLYPEIVRTPAHKHALGEQATLAQRRTAWRRALTNAQRDIDKARDELAELLHERKE